MKALFVLPLTLAIVVCSATQLVAQFSKHFAGPYNLILRGLDDCPEYESLPAVFKGNKLRKYNRTTYLFSTKLVNTVPISNEMTLTFAPSTFGNGGWSSNQVEQNIGPVCKVMWTLVPITMKAFLDSVGKDDCPIMPGNYTQRDFLFDTNINWPLVPYGKYRYEVKFRLKDKVALCKRVFMDWKQSILNHPLQKIEGSISKAKIDFPAQKSTTAVKKVQAFSQSHARCRNSSANSEASKRSPPLLQE
ncbi:hypothetical protein AAG570_002843 [Ranatra chinensis]|uniref:Uncharacterized protein n=1 Tax=Ranatra chinensis TaxID=642074 RepID=A0ABD0YJD5_9HEMI